MHAVIVEREADHERVHAEYGLEIADDRNRTAGADGHGFFAPLFGERGSRLAQRWIVERNIEGRSTGEIAELDLAIARQARADEFAEVLANLFGILVPDQAERNLRHGFARNDGFCPLTRIAADDAVHLGGRARGNLLDQQAALLAGRDFQPDRAEEL